MGRQLSTAFCHTPAAQLALQASPSCLHTLCSTQPWQLAAPGAPGPPPAPWLLCSRCSCSSQQPAAGQPLLQQPLGSRAAPAAAAGRAPAAALRRSRSVCPQRSTRQAPRPASCSRLTRRWTGAGTGQSQQRSRRAAWHATSCRGPRPPPAGWVWDARWAHMLARSTACAASCAARRHCHLKPAMSPTYSALPPARSGLTALPCTSPAAPPTRPRRRSRPRHWRPCRAAARHLRGERPGAGRGGGMWRGRCSSGPGLAGSNGDGPPLPCPAVPQVLQGDGCGTGGPLRLQQVRAGQGLATRSAGCRQLPAVPARLPIPRLRARAPFGTALHALLAHATHHWCPPLLPCRPPNAACLSTCAR